MPMKKQGIVLIFVVCILSMTKNVNAFVFQHNSNQDIIQYTPDNAVVEFFNLLTFDPGNCPDWEKVKVLFIEEAVIVYRLGPKTSRTFNKHSFIDYLIFDIKRAKLNTLGLSKKIIKKDTQIIKNVAVCNVLYEVSIPGLNNNEPVNKGFSSFHLVRKENKWLIVSIVNEGFSNTETLPSF